MAPHQSDAEDAVIKSGAVKLRVRGLLGASWQPRQLQLESGALVVSRQGGRSPKRLSVAGVSASLDRDANSELVVQLPNAAAMPTVRVKCRSDLEARSWVEGFRRVIKQQEQQGADVQHGGKLSRLRSPAAGKAPPAEASSAGSADVPAAAQAGGAGGAAPASEDTSALPVKYDPKEDVADISIFQVVEEHPKGMPSVTMVHGGISFGQKLVQGVFRLPGEQKLGRRRETMNSAQALLLLWRDARTMKAKGKFDESRRLLEEHLELAQLVYGKQSDKVVSSMQLLAGVLSDQGLHAEAQALLEDAAALEQTIAAAA